MSAVITSPGPTYAAIAPAMTADELASLWCKLGADEASPDRFELTEYGEVVVSTSPTNRHQFIIALVAEQMHAQLGVRVIYELAVHAAHAGIRKPDLAWLPPERQAEAASARPLAAAPPLVVDVWSPGNTRAEMQLKTSGYLAAGVQEVVHVGLDGSVLYVRADGEHAVSAMGLRLDLPPEFF